MSRLRAIRHCPDCGQTPSPDPLGRLLCACPGKPWAWDGGYPGTDEERKKIESCGFELTTDAAGEVYYCWNGHILYLFSDGTWDSDKAPNGMTLEEYLNSVSAVQGEIP